MDDTRPVRETSRLNRVLEPEVMDSADEAREYDAMDHGEVNRRFAEDFLAAVTQAGIAGERIVLDLGTGTAQIPIEICRRSPAVRLVAVDLSAEMLALAAENVRRAGMTDRIQLQRIDAKQLPYGDGRFHAVISNSIVHHIPQPQGTLAEALRVVRKPGGLILIRDLARPHDDAEVRRLVDRYAGGCNPHQRQLFDDSLRAALTVHGAREMVAALGGASDTVQASSDRHWTWRQIF